MSASDLTGRARELSWYHTLELAPGFRTEGLFDLSTYVDRVGLPDRLDGLRALDVGTFDGFWAFELERRGAEVVAIDIDHDSERDWPPRRVPQDLGRSRRRETFELAREALGARVERIACNVYDARPERLGQFDLVFCGSVLLHLRDQFLALERLAELARGRLILLEEYEPRLALVPFPAARFLAERENEVVFWLPSARAWKRLAVAAGFDKVIEHARFKLRSREGWAVRHLVLHAEKGARPGG